MEFAAKAQTMPRARLGFGSWQFEDDALARLRDKIVKGRKTLGEVYGAPLFGIKTGLNDVRMDAEGQYYSKGDTAPPNCTTVGVFEIDEVTKEWIGSSLVRPLAIGDDPRAR